MLRNIFGCGRYIRDVEAFKGQEGIERLANRGFVVDVETLLVIFARESDDRLARESVRSEQAIYAEFHVFEISDHALANAVAL